MYNAQQDEYDSLQSPEIINTAPRYLRIYQAQHNPLQLRLPTLIQLRQNNTLQLLRLLRTRPALHNLPIPTNQEFLKIPLNPLQTHQAGLLFLHPLEQRLRIIPIDLRLAHNGKRDAVVDLAERLDVVIGPGLLTAELVTREAEYREVCGVLFFDGFVELFEPFVLRGEAAF